MSDRSSAWETWVRKHVEKEIAALSEEIADAIARNIIRERKQAAARMAELEQRLAALEGDAAGKKTAAAVAAAGPDGRYVQ